MSFQSGSALGNYNKAKQVCPLLTLIQCADEMATNIIEMATNIMMKTRLII